MSNELNDNNIDDIPLSFSTRVVHGKVIKETCGLCSSLMEEDFRRFR